MDEHRLAPLLTPEVALEIYKRYMDVKLKWIKDSNAERPVYRLIYELVTISRSEPSSGFVNRKLRYIDARSGELIWGKYLKGERNFRLTNVKRHERMYACTLSGYKVICHGIRRSCFIKEK
ncbi:hypothetical protein NST07_15525 [Paenibacillus sp. FSL L8-0340]|uniref:hypothetical protein n=1 Tax=Paenibacillus sp. FSL L8-0340 TaxID=2954685 RepID=UPI0031595D3E